MSDQYLWDKTGSDPEIEGLEQVLAAVRYIPVPAPELPAAPARRFSWDALRITLGIGIPAAAAAAVAIFVWTPSPAENIAADRPATAPVEIVAADTRSAEDVPAPTALEPVPVPELLTFSRPVFRTNSRDRRQRPVLAKAQRPRSAEPQLTQEERFAYDQVRLALSISADKLKIVRDSVNNADEE